MSVFVLVNVMLKVKEVLKLLQLVLPRRFLILLNLHLPSLLVHAL